MRYGTTISGIWALTLSREHKRTKLQIYKYVLYSKKAEVCKNCIMKPLMIVMMVMINFYIL